MFDTVEITSNFQSHRRAGVLEEIERLYVGESMQRLLVDFDNLIADRESAVTCANASFRYVANEDPGDGI